MDAQRPKKSRKKWIIAGVIVAALILAAKALDPTKDATRGLKRIACGGLCYAHKPHLVDNKTHVEFYDDNAIVIVELNGKKVKTIDLAKGNEELSGVIFPETESGQEYYAHIYTPIKNGVRRYIKVVNESDTTEIPVDEVQTKKLSEAKGQEQWYQWKQDNIDMKHEACKDFLKNNDKVYTLKFMNGNADAFLVNQSFDKATLLSYCFVKPTTPGESIPEPRPFIDEYNAAYKMAIMDAANFTDFIEVGDSNDGARRYDHISKDLHVVISDDVCWNGCGQKATITYGDKTASIKGRGGQLQMFTGLKHFGFLKGDSIADDESFVFEYGGTIYKMPKP